MMRRVVLAVTFAALSAPDPASAFHVPYDAPWQHIESEHREWVAAREKQEREDIRAAQEFRERAEAARQAAEAAQRVERARQEAEAQRRREAEQERESQRQHEKQVACIRSGGHWVGFGGTTGNCSQLSPRELEIRIR